MSAVEPQVLAFMLEVARTLMGLLIFMVLGIILVALWELAHWVHRRWSIQLVLFLCVLPFFLVAVISACHTLGSVFLPK